MGTVMDASGALYRSHVNNVVTVCIKLYDLPERNRGETTGRGIDNVSLKIVPKICPVPSQGVEGVANCKLAMGHECDKNVFIIIISE